MLYTSGTTGRPKGVLLSERNLAETAINFAILGEVDSQSSFLCESPMFHIIGMVTSIRPAFLNGASIAISDGFIPERTLARMADPALRISHYFCVPQMALSLRAADGFSPDSLKGLKAIFTGGAPHPAPQINAWLDDGIAIVDGYGMSEAGTVFGMLLDREIIAAKAGCVGLPTPRVQCRLVGESAEQVAEGEPGELQLKGDNITIGYWQHSTTRVLASSLWSALRMTSGAKSVAFSMCLNGPPSRRMRSRIFSAHGLRSTRFQRKHRPFLPCLVMA